MMCSSWNLLLLVVLVTLSAQVFEVEGWTKINSLAHLTKYKSQNSPDTATAGTTCELKFQDCGSVEGSLLKASMVNGTCNSGVAILKKGSTAYIDFQFNAKVAESKLKSKVAGKIGPLPFVNFPLDNPDACKDSGLKCPVPANQNVDYVPHINVLSSYPSVNVIVKWELQDENNEKDVFCILIPATIQ